MLSAIVIKLKIKKHVVLAGLSLVKLLWKVCMGSKLDISIVSLNNKWWIAFTLFLVKVILVVTADGHITLLNMCNLITTFTNLSIHMSPVTGHILNKFFLAMKMVNRVSPWAKVYNLLMVELIPKT